MWPTAGLNEETCVHEGKQNCFGAACGGQCGDVLYYGKDHG